MSNYFDIIIIGGGPAGISAMLQLDRYDYSKIMIRDSFLGGLLRAARKIENYPGIGKSLSGIELSQSLKEDFKDRDIFSEVDRITSVEQIEGRFVSHSKSGKEYYSDAVIIATGTKPKDIDGDFSKEVNVDLFKRSIVDLPKNLESHKIIIIGSGEAACDSALSILEKGGKPVILCRGEVLKINRKLEAELKEKEIEIHFSSTLKIMKEQFSGKIFIELENRKNYTSDFVMACIGRTKNHFSIPELSEGLYFAGDLLRENDRYMGLAVGDGIKAAMDCIRFLSEKRDRT